MNRFLLLLGSLLLLALTTALIAPRFIDWSNYTDIIEEQASRVLGREVHVSGAVDLRFLPCHASYFPMLRSLATRTARSQGLPPAGWKR
jgi:hypothetical protein